MQFLPQMKEWKKEQNHISIFCGSQGKGREVGEILFMLVSLKTDFQAQDWWDLILQSCDSQCEYNDVFHNISSIMNEM